MSIARDLQRRVRRSHIHRITARAFRTRSRASPAHDSNSQIELKTRKSESHARAQPIHVETSLNRVACDHCPSRSTTFLPRPRSRARSSPACPTPRAAGTLPSHCSRRHAEASASTDARAVRTGRDVKEGLARLSHGVVPTNVHELSGADAVSPSADLIPPGVPPCHPRARAVKLSLNAHSAKCGLPICCRGPSTRGDVEVTQRGRATRHLPEIAAAVEGARTKGSPCSSRRFAGENH